MVFIFIQFNRDVGADNRSEDLTHRPNPFHRVGHYSRSNSWQPITSSYDQQITKTMLNSSEPTQVYTSTESNIYYDG
ncbi:MAG: hypothetical protein C5S47_05385 [Candidatus Methanogasteraceae archaeon]|nr:MAG: hypothetical protein C5S47_05385 [ANME-2 cluster archaeon]